MVAKWYNYLRESKESFVQVNMVSLAYKAHWVVKEARILPQIIVQFPLHLMISFTGWGRWYSVESVRIEWIGAGRQLLS